MNKTLALAADFTLAAIDSRNQRLQGRRSRSLMLPIAALCGCICMVQDLHAQAAAGAAAPQLPWLEVKSGCWQIRQHLFQTSTADTDAAGASAADAANRQYRDWLNKLTPEQRAKISPQDMEAQRKMIAVLADAARKAPAQRAAIMQKGATLTQITCTATPFANAHAMMYGSSDPAKQCVRTATDSGGVRHMHLACSDHEADFERTDAQHFKGSTARWAPAGDASAKDIVRDATTFAGKWISEQGPHLPSSPPTTDLDGVRHLGPFAVASFDPYRLVAEIDGHRFIAQRAYLLLNYASEGAAQTWGPTLPELFQNIYMRNAVAATALREGLRKAGPNAIRSFDTQPQKWLQLCGDWSCEVNRDSPGHSSTAFMLKHDAEAMEPTLNDLWGAYFKRYPTQAEKAAALANLKSKYKLTVLDPDFFAGHRRD